MEKQVSFEVVVTMRGESLNAPSPVRLTETFEVSGSGFAHLLDVLGRFHELAEKIRDEQAGLKRAGR